MHQIKEKFADQKKQMARSNEVVLNLNLEALVTMDYQDKLKRDRIGIIF